MQHLLIITSNKQIYSDYEWQEDEVISLSPEEKLEEYIENYNKIYSDPTNWGITSKIVKVYSLLNEIPVYEKLNMS